MPTRPRVATLKTLIAASPFRVISLIGLAVVFGTDCLTSLGFAHGGLYPLLVVVSGLACRGGWVVGITTAGILLTALGFFTSPETAAASDLSYVVTNRLVSALAIAITGALTLAVLKQREKAAAAQQALQTTYEIMRSQQQLLEIASEVGRLGGWRLSLPSKTVTWSDEVARIHDEAPGFSPTLAAGLSYYLPADRDRLLAALSNCLESGTAYDEELQLVTAKGRQIWVRTIGQPIRTRSGAIIGAQGAYQDITAQKHAEASVALSEQRFRLMADTLPLIVWTATPEGIVDYTSQELRNYTGMLAPTPDPREEWMELVHPDDRDRCVETWLDSMQNGKSYVLEFRLRRHDGIYGWLLSRGEPIKNDDGTIIKWFGNSIDIHDRKIASERATALAQRLNSVLESITDAFFTLDQAWRFTFVNKRAEEILRRPSSELLGQSLWDCYADIIGSIFEDKYRAAMVSKESTQFEAYYGPLESWFDINAYPSSEGLAVYFRDITERKESEFALQESEERFRTLLQAMPNVAIQGYGLDGRVNYWNRASELLYGYSEAEAIASNLLDLIIPPKLRPAVSASLEQIKEGGAPPENGELLLMHKDGSPVIVYSSHAVLRRHNHAPELFCVDIDLSSLKKAEAATQLSEERFRLLAKATADAVWDWDLVTNTYWWGDGLETLFGYNFDPSRASIEFYLGQLHPDDHATVDTSLKEAIAGGANEWSCQYRFRRQDGRYVHVLDRGYIIRDAEGQPLRMLGGMTDVSDRITLEEQLRQSQRLESVGQLTGGIAHDFNNLLTVILGNAELVLEELDPDTRFYPLIQMVSNAAMRGADLTQRLLAFARRQPLDPKAVDINELIKGTESLLRRTLGEYIQLEWVHGAGLWPALVDPSQLENALLNLCLNARDAMEYGGQLTLETANARIDQDYADQYLEVKPGQYVMIAISDTGIGIPPEAIDHVFEPFFTTKPKGKGTGLGLSMVFGFVKQSGGHIKVYSELGEGTTIKLYLPRCPVLVNAIASNPQAAIGGSELILLVEDDDLVRRYGQDQLQSLGYRVLIAENGLQALDVIRVRDDIDLLFTDIVMPGGISGRELADRALELRPRLKVLFTSGYTENAIVHQGRLDPGVTLLGKPYRRAELAQKIRAVINE